MASWTNPLDYSVGQATCVQRFDERILDNLTFAGSHAHSGSAGDGAAISGSQIKANAGNQYVYQYVTISPYLPSSMTSGNINQANTGAINGGWHQITDTKGASSKYLTDCDKGAWTISLYYRKNAGNGIISVCFNGASVGQVDMYGSPATDDNLSDASLFTVSASGQYTLKFEATASNVSSTGYVANIQHIELRRLSA